MAKGGVAKAAVGGMLHFSGASTALSNVEFNTDFQVSFFPNPTKDSLNINMGNLEESNYKFTLIDINGKIVLEKTIENPSLIEKINIVNIQKGIYLATLLSGDKKVTKKLVFE